MDLQALGQTLRRLGIPDLLVSLGQENNSAWCVVPDSQGGWEVYWNAGGTKHSHATLPHESAACYYLLGRLVHDQMLAGEFDFPG